MVDCQLNPNGIIHPRLLQLFSVLPREIFLPEEQRTRAYADEDLILPDGTVMMEPLVHARMVQSLQPQPDDIVLMIGDMTGYASALLCGMVTTVVTLEPQPGMFDRARQVWSDIGANNIAVVAGQNYRGSPEHAPFSLIILHGAVTHVPEHMLEQLTPGGRLVTVLRAPEDHIGRITLISRDGENNFSVATLQDAATPYLTGLGPQPYFKFA
jgi:protein-L-isoaspartate(D-aspartate) O-methyltransferase